MNQEVHLLFIDLAKAYDNVPISKLWEVLRRTNINQTIIQAVQALYKESRIKIKIGRKVSKEIFGRKVSEGLKQPVPYIV